MPFFTINQVFFAELEVKKSRFLTFFIPFEHFSERLTQLREAHPKASHHVTAFRHRLEDGRINEGAKDDGEPSGTSGMPMLKVLIGRELIDVGVVCIRYFGGTKLGAGGLSRAYSGALRQVVDEATLVPWQKITQKEFSVGFSEASEVELWISANAVQVVSRDYTETGVTFILQAAEELLAEIPST